MDSEKLFKENLYRLRCIHKYTKKQVAEGIGIAQSYYGYLENLDRHHQATFSLIDKLCDFYDITPDKLFKQV